MLDKEFATKFIERVTRYTDFNVNIMDERGIIIASRDKKRIGQYHEIAYRLITGPEEMIDTTGMSFPNVLPGINMIIATGGRREGVVGVTGDPEEVRPVALMVKMAFETMLKYEQQLEQQRIRENKKEHFIHLLTQVEHSDPEELRSYARDLGYPEESVRIPILVRLDGAETDKEGKKGKAYLEETYMDAGRTGRALDPLRNGNAGSVGQALDLLRGGPRHSGRDFSFAMDSRHILIYKAMPDPESRSESMFSVYKDLVREYLEPLGLLDRRLSAASEKRSSGRTGKRLSGTPGKQLSGSSGKSAPGSSGGYTAFVGSFQDTYPQYCYGYRHCRWLEQNAASAGGEDLVFFYDHLEEYMRSLLPAGELQRAFYVYRSCIPEQKLRTCAETIGALIRTNYNFGMAADMLFVHKNTLVYRYKRLKEMLGVDPMTSAGDRAFLELFYAYLLRTGGSEEDDL